MHGVEDAVGIGGGTNATSLPSLATYSGSRPSNPQASRTPTGTGIASSSSSTPTLAARAISLREAPMPPRVGSRSTCTSAPVASMAATNPCSGAVSLHSVVPNSSPSRQLSTAIPCSPISPLTSTISPGRARWGRMSTPSGTSPMPAVLMKMPSPCPVSTTLVSPVTSRTSAASAAVPTASAMRAISASAVPSSRMNAVESAIGRAPDIARSFTVPFTARSPIEPPGNTSGLTTNESVENASRKSPRGAPPNRRARCRRPRRTRAGTGARSARPTSHHRRRVPSRCWARRAAAWGRPNHRCRVGEIRLPHCRWCQAWATSAGRSRRRYR